MSYSLFVRCWCVAATSATEGGYLVWKATLGGASVTPTWTKIEIISGTATVGVDAQNFLNDNSLVSFDGGVTWGQPVVNGNMVAVPPGITTLAIRIKTFTDTLNEGTETLQLKITELGGTGFDATPVTAKGSIYDASCTPLVLDLNGDGVGTLAMAQGVQFDLTAGAQGPRDIGWVDRTDGLLAIDLNGNGLIDNGSELFGSASALKDGGSASDGFQALAQYDSNRDGQVDAQDAAFGQLRVWVDRNANGRTDAGELLNLAQAGVASIGVAAVAGSSTEQGNLLGLLGQYRTTQGTLNAVADVWFDSGSRRVERPAAGGSQLVDPSSADDEADNPWLTWANGQGKARPANAAGMQRLVSRMLARGAAAAQHHFEVMPAPTPSPHAALGGTALLDDAAWLQALEHKAGKTLREMA